MAIRAIARCTELGDLPVPDEFIQSISKDELQGLMTGRSIMDADQKERLWRALGRNDRIPERVELMISLGGIIEANR